MGKQIQPGKNKNKFNQTLPRSGRTYKETEDQVEKNRNAVSDSKN